MNDTAQGGNAGTRAAGDAPSEMPSEGRSWEAQHYGIPAAGWRRRAFIVVFESDTRAGRLFDLWLLALIVVSVVVVMLDSVGDIARARGMTQIAQDAGIGREALYKALRPDASPRFDTISRVCKALGVKLVVQPVAHA